VKSVQSVVYFFQQHSTRKLPAFIKGDKIYMNNGHSPTPDKTALVLAGGGLTGAVYEVGALRAIDDLLVDRTVNDFDIYVGTSAGSIVASLLANGLSPNTILQMIDGSHPELHPVERQHIFNLNALEFLRRSIGLPGKLVGAWSHYLRHFSDMGLFDLVWSLTEALPSGLYDGMALERYLQRLLSGSGLSNNFEELERDLYVIATDLDSGDRAVFSRDEHNHVPISLAIAASAALPVVYQPIRIGDREYLDGGLRGNASLDLAIEQGAKLVVCINPLVPYDNSARSSIPFLGADGGYLSRKGLQFIAAQATRIVTHSSLHYHVKQLRRSHPDVDILLIEPAPDDYQMFFYNIMRYSARLTIAEHGFESVTLKLAEDFSRYQDALTKHGIPITQRLVNAELQEIQDSGYNSTVVQRVLEKGSERNDRQKSNTPTGKLTKTLAELELVLNSMPPAAS